MKEKLDKYEQGIEDNIEKFKPVAPKTKRKIEGIITRARKNRSISLRINNFDLELIKERANENGIPYQTLINNIIHKYVTNQFYEKNEMLKSIKLLKVMAG